MRQRTILFQLYSFILVLLILTIGGLAGLFIGTTKNFYYSERKTDLINTTRILKNLMDSRGFPETTEELEIYSEMAVTGTESRISVIDPSGVVLADSEGEVHLMSNHSGRPEVKAAMAGDEGYSLRFSATISRTLMYVAMPVYNDGELKGVVRIAYPGDTIKTRIWGVIRTVSLISIIVLIIAALVSLVIARKFSLVINEIRQAAAHFSQEDFSVMLELEKPEELKELGEALNAMARQLKMRIDTIRAQRNEFEAILDNMSEPVILTDTIMNIRNINRAAKRTFNLEDEPPEGRNILSIFRNTRLHDFGESVLRKGNSGVLELDLNTGSSSVIMQIHATPLIDSDESKAGLLFVMHDVTQTIKLELMRKDFVASVSHELKTPITNIKGYVESLREHPEMPPKQSGEFLSIIARHTDRLAFIIDDLLTLSEIEKRDNDVLRTEMCSVNDLLTSVVQVCGPGAERKHIDIKLECSEDLEYRLHPLLAEQAVLNLVDNAVKYSPKKTEILIRAGIDENGRCRVDVSDQGPGIEKEDLERIFERFYRVDKARSRDAGGTGLGLSIVKHIALAHGGTVQAESEVEKGSVFTIFF